LRYFRDFLIAAIQLPWTFKKKGLGPGLALGLFPFWLGCFSIFFTFDFQAEDDSYLGWHLGNHRAGSGIIGAIPSMLHT
jgi:hypothetical protein